MSGHQAGAPRVRVYCDDPAALTPSGKPWHARGARVLGDYLRTETATGAPLWEERPDVPSRAQRAIEGRGGSLPIGTSVDEGGRLVWVPGPARWDKPAAGGPLGDREYRAGRATLYAVRDGETLAPRDLDRLLVRLRRRPDVEPLAACLWFAWRCPCGRELVCPHGDVAPILDAVAARGKWRVSLADLAAWVGDTPSA